MHCLILYICTAYYLYCLLSCRPYRLYCLPPHSARTSCTASHCTAHTICIACTAAQVEAIARDGDPPHAAAAEAAVNSARTARLKAIQAAVKVVKPGEVRGGGSEGADIMISYLGCWKQCIYRHAFWCLAAYHARTAEAHMVMNLLVKHAVC